MQQVTSSERRSDSRPRSCRSRQQLTPQFTSSLCDLCKLSSFTGFYARCLYLRLVRRACCRRTDIARTILTRRSCRRDVSDLRLIYIGRARLVSVTMHHFWHTIMRQSSYQWLCCASLPVSHLSRMPFAPLAERQAHRQTTAVTSVHAWTTLTRILHHLALK